MIFSFAADVILLLRQVPHRWPLPRLATLPTLRITTPITRNRRRRVAPLQHTLRSLHALWPRETIAAAFFFGHVAVTNHLRLIIILWVIVRTFFVLVFVDYLVSDRQPLISQSSLVDLLIDSEWLGDGSISLIKLQSVLILHHASVGAVAGGVELAGLFDVLFILLIPRNLILRHQIRR